MSCTSSCLLDLATEGRFIHAANDCRSVQNWSQDRRRSDQRHTRNVQDHVKKERVSSLTIQFRVLRYHKSKFNSKFLFNNLFIFVFRYLVVDQLDLDKMLDDCFSQPMANKKNRRSSTSSLENSLVDTNTSIMVNNHINHLLDFSLLIFVIKKKKKKKEPSANVTRVADKSKNKLDVSNIDSTISSTSTSSVVATSSRAAKLTKTKENRLDDDLDDGDKQQIMQGGVKKQKVSLTPATKLNRRWYTTYMLD